MILIRKFILERQNRLFNQDLKNIFETIKKRDVKNDLFMRL